MFSSCIVGVSCFSSRIRCLFLPWLLVFCIFVVLNWIMGLHALCLILFFQVFFVFPVGWVGCGCLILVCCRLCIPLLIFLSCLVWIPSILTGLVVHCLGSRWCCSICVGRWLLLWNHRLSMIMHHRVSFLCLLGMWLGLVVVLLIFRVCTLCLSLWVSFFVGMSCLSLEVWVILFRFFGVLFWFGCFLIWLLMVCFLIQSNGLWSCWGMCWFVSGLDCILWYGSLLSCHIGVLLSLQLFYSMVFGLFCWIVWLHRSIRFGYMGLGCCWLLSCLVRGHRIYCSLP